MVKPVFSRNITAEGTVTWYALKFKYGAAVAKVWERGGSITFHDPAPGREADMTDCDFLNGPCNVRSFLHDDAPLAEIRDGADPWPILAALLVDHHADEVRDWRKPLTSEPLPTDEKGE